tara:strand:- start:13326 stop:14375 length:1050 start_codon:yes stop_codon:yes gene_type:complete
MSHNWEKILISKQTSIKDVLTIIDKEAMKLALVVEDDRTLLGTISDGDIRRALIKNESLSRPVFEIMNSAPVTAAFGTSRADLLKIMEGKELLSIPLLNESKVVGLETLHHALQHNKYDNPVFLMAGGFGTRLKPLTDNCPKPLLKVGDKPILETTLISFIQCGFTNFYISTHYLPEMIRSHFGDGEKWGVSIAYVHELEPLGTGGALGLLPKEISDLPVIIMNGDVLTKINYEHLLAFHNEKGSYATMCVREFEYQVPFGVVESEDLKIKSMEEKPVQRFHVNAGIYVVSKALIDSVSKNECIDMPSLFERCLDQNVLIYPFHEYWLDIGRIDDFRRAQIDIQTLGLI